MRNIILSIPMFLTLLISCNSTEMKRPELLDAKKFNTTIEDENVSLYTLESGNGIYMQITNFGGRVVSLYTPDKNGDYEDIVLGYDNINSYINNNGERFLGPVVGRYANRIAEGKFIINDITYNVPINNNGQSLHGGLKGLDMVVWSVEKISKNEIVLSHFSRDGDEGYPGNLNIEMSYSLTPLNEFKICYKATTDKTTIVNLSHHGLFNLKGEGKGTINDHVLTINANYITPIDKNLIPTGEYLNVENTPFDFTKAKTIGKDILTENEQLNYGKGYDHNWVISQETPESIIHMATLYEPNNGRIMEVWSDQPGLQFYSGNFFNGKISGKYGRNLNFREALALETQKFPDSPNNPHFPSTILNPKETYSQTCIYKFKTKK